MKKAFLLIIIFSSSFCYAQMETNFVSKDSSDMIKLVDSVLANTKNEYRLDTIVSNKSGAIEFRYSDNSHKLRIEFTMIKSGGNKDLELPDTMRYTFVSLTGFYQDIFTFWKKYYQPDADLVSVANMGSGKVIIKPEEKGSWVSSFNKYDDEWQVFNRFDYDPNKM